MSPIVVAGMAGSGTTHLWWVLSHDPLVRNRFCEPLDPDLPHQIQKLDHYKDYARKRQIYRFWDPVFSWNKPVLNMGDTYPELKQYLKYILRGRTLVKTNSMNLRLAWLRSNFRGIKIIYLVRDPRAVASTHQFGILPSIELWKINIEYVMKIYDTNFKLIRYEDLCLDINGTLKSIYEFLGRKPPYGVQVFAAIGRGAQDWSSRTSIGTLTEWKKTLGVDWKNVVCDADISELMHQFGYKV